MMSETTEEHLRTELARWKSYYQDAFDEINELKALIEKSILFQLAPGVLLEQNKGKWTINESRPGEGVNWCLTDEGKWVGSWDGKAHQFESWQRALAAWRIARGTDDE